MNDRSADRWCGFHRPPQLRLQLSSKICFDVVIKHTKTVWNPKKKRKPHNELAYVDSDKPRRWVKLISLLRCDRIEMPFWIRHFYYRVVVIMLFALMFYYIFYLAPIKATREPGCKAPRTIRRRKQNKKKQKKKKTNYNLSIFLTK